MSKIIGIVPAAFVGDPEKSCMEDIYKLNNTYISRTLEAGCIPVGLAPKDLWLTEEQLELCDGFVVQGGRAFYPYHFQVIHHAVTTGKRYLGICLGQQLIYVYFELLRRVREQGCTGDPVPAICSYIKAQGKGFSLQRPIPDHRREFPMRGDEDTVKHDVCVVPGTLLHRVLGQDTMRIATFHYLSTPPEQALVTVNAWHGDVVEGTEYGENILGVQGHPEIDSFLPQLFTFLAE